MNSQSSRYILEPIDPLNISFSEDKCVRTPETHQSNPKTISKDPINLFSFSLTESSTSPKRSLSKSRKCRPLPCRFTQTYKSQKKCFPLDFGDYQRYSSSNKKGRKHSQGIGKFSADRMEFHKLDHLLNKINIRIQSNRLHPLFKH